MVLSACTRTKKIGVAAARRVGPRACLTMPLCGLFACGMPRPDSNTASEGPKNQPPTLAAKAQPASSEANSLPHPFVATMMETCEASRYHEQVFGGKVPAGVADAPSNEPAVVVVHEWKGSAPVLTLREFPDADLEFPSTYSPLSVCDEEPCDCQMQFCVCADGKLATPVTFVPVRQVCEDYNLAKAVRNWNLPPPKIDGTVSQPACVVVPLSVQPGRPGARFPLPFRTMKYHVL